MLFLLNDVVFDLDATCPVTPGDARRFETLGLDYVLELGCELRIACCGKRLGKSAHAGFLENVMTRCNIA